VAANVFSSSVSVLLGKGDGTFRQQVQYAAGAYPVAVGLADLNGDGKLDIVTENTDWYSTTPTVSLLLGNGDGTFQPHMDYPTGPGPYKEIAFADLNGDGHLDVIVPDSNDGGSPGYVGVLLGNGDGTLQPYADYSTGAGDVSVAIGDFNGDRKLDIASANASASTVSVLLGNGDGTFQPHVDYPLPTTTYSVVTADFNRDGKLDLALSTGGAGAAIYVLLGNGDGTFQPYVAYPTASNPVQVVAADFNGDGRLDLAASTGADTVSVLLGKGDGTFLRWKDFPIAPYGYALAVGDLNNDGAIDVVTADVFAESVGVLLNRAGTKLKLTSSPNPSTFGQPVTFTLTVTPSFPSVGSPSGTVQFRNGTTLLGSAPLISGQASFTSSALSEGSHTIVAGYSGDRTFNRNKSQLLVQQVQ
jgi:hypothetical protein